MASRSSRSCHLPPLSMEALLKQVDYLIPSKCMPCLEFSKVGFFFLKHNMSPRYYDRGYQKMWKLPIFRCGQRAEVQPLFKAVCTWLEQVATGVFTQHGWQHNLRIRPSHLSTQAPCRSIGLYYYRFVGFCFLMVVRLLVFRLCASQLCRGWVLLIMLYIHLMLHFLVNKMTLYQKNLSSGAPMPRRCSRRWRRSRRSTLTPMSESLASTTCARCSASASSPSGYLVVSPSRPYYELKQWPMYEGLL